MLFFEIMRIIRMKHKARLAAIVVVCVIALLLLITKNSGNYFEMDHFATRSIGDNINIGNEVPTEEKETTRTKTGVHKTAHTRGKSKIHVRKVPRPPKRRIADGVVDRKVEQNVVHGDDITGQIGRARGRRERKVKKSKTTNEIKQGKLLLSKGYFSSIVL